MGVRTLREHWCGLVGLRKAGQPWVGAIDRHRIQDYDFLRLSLN